MADSMILTRGLAIPDPNFLHPINTAWTYEGFSSSDFSVETADVGCGRALKINIDDAATTTHILTSSFTPYGILGAPWGSTSADRTNGARPELATGPIQLTCGAMISMWRWPIL